MDIFEQQEIPKEVIHSLFSFAYCEGLLQGMGEASGARSHATRPVTAEAVNDLILRWFAIEEIGNE